MKGCQQGVGSKAPGRTHNNGFKKTNSDSAKTWARSVSSIEWWMNGSDLVVILWVPIPYIHSKRGWINSRILK